MSASFFQDKDRILLVDNLEKVATIMAVALLDILKQKLVSTIQASIQKGSCFLKAMLFPTSSHYAPGIGRTSL
jgi:hypothetical protein